MAWKNTIIFDYSSGDLTDNAIRRAGGFSESYLSDTQLRGDAGVFKKLIEARASLMPRGTSIRGWRVSDMEGKLGSFADVLFIPGTAGLSGDMATTAVQLSQGNGPNRLKLVLRSLPDEWMRSGDLQDYDAFTKAIAPFKKALEPFYQICRKKDAPQSSIDNITTEGVISLITARPEFVKDTFLYLLRPKCTLKRKLEKYRVTVKSADSLTITIAGWDGGAAKGGRARLVDTVNVNYVASEISFDFLVSKKVGRPFFSQRGRR